MKIENQIIDSNNPREMVKKIKEALRRWYATVSVKELAVNRALTAEIEALERLLSRAEVVS